MSRRAKTDFFEPLLGVRIWRRRPGYDFVRPVRAPADPPSSPTGQRAPDYVEPTVGWRIWRVIRYGDVHLLASPMINVVWPSRAPLEARCLQTLVGVRHDDPSPAEHCSCGIYATRLEALPTSMLAHQLLRPLVVGSVSLWGHVLEGETGWRASRAYPRMLYVPYVGVDPSRRQRGLVDALAHYGVPVGLVRVPTFAEVAQALPLQRCASACAATGERSSSSASAIAANTSDLER